MSGLSVLSGKFYLHIYLPIYHIIYHCQILSICIFMYIYSYIYICKYSMLHINMFLYYLLYKVGYFTKHNFHDVHLRLLWRPSSRSIYACSSSFYRPVWFCVKTMKLRHTMSPAPPQKKTMQSLNIENWFLISIPWRICSSHHPNLVGNKMKTTNQTISCFLWSSPSSLLVAYSNHIGGWCRLGTSKFGGYKTNP